jgi:hypothetical protein
VVLGHLGELAAECAVARPHDPPTYAHTVGVCNRRRPVEGGLQVADLAREVRFEGQLLRNDERRDEHDVRSAVGGEAAGEVEGMLGLGAAEKRNDDAAISDRCRAPCETAGVPAGRAQIREPDHSAW